ncbi:hypothetical protein MMC11_008181 [Xylographa trunciseda]|nr:hypothetical protein [Xylographa trunciseda]
MLVASARPAFLEYLPSRSSPLSTRDPNACHWFPAFSTKMANPTNDASKPSFPKRQSKFATLVKSRDTENVKRRDKFFQKIKQNGDDRRWEVRGEQVRIAWYSTTDLPTHVFAPQQILRTDFLSRQKQWEEEQARRAQELAAEPDDEDMEAGDAPDSSHEFDLVEQFLSQEDQELEMTISMLEYEKQSEAVQNAMTDYGSEDEEYDQYFMDIIHQVEQKTPGATVAAEAQQDQEMDFIMD